jgi:DNA primase catalytic core
MNVSKDGIERIKGANELASVVAERGVELKKKGKTLVGRCPFHTPDKTPSFTVTPGKGLFHCFGCGASGDVIGFVSKHDKLSFPRALETLARRAGLDLAKVMEERPRIVRAAPFALTPPAPEVVPAAVLARVVEHYHRTFCERKDAQEYLAGRGLVDPDILRALKVGYADGSLLEAIPKTGELREQLLALGVITKENRELLGGCVVVPIPDPLSGQWANLYGRGVKVARHCYLPGTQRGVLNFQAARTSEEVVLAESILDALSFHQAGIATAIPLYGTSGFTADMLDLLKREKVRRVTLALDNDEAGRKATDALKEKLTAAGLVVRVASLPTGIKDPSELLVSRNGDAGEAFRALLDAAEPRPAAAASALPAAAGAASGVAARTVAREGERLVLGRAGIVYSAEVQSSLLGRLKAKVKAGRPGDARFHADSFDLYASRARSEFARKAARLLGDTAEAIEEDLLCLLVEAEKQTGEEPRAAEVPPAEMSAIEREEALAFLRSQDLLDQVARDADALGYVGEVTNVKLLYALATSRKLDDPSSALILSQSGAGKSQATVVIEWLIPPEDVVLFTRVTPQSLYYVEPGFLDRKLVIIEERNGSLEADYSIRVLQSRKKLVVAVPIKDPATGNMRTRTFVVEARASFIEATTASAVNHENATRCFELTMDESVEQTRRIHERQRLRRTEVGLALREKADALKRRHWNAQRLLEPAPVVIPYADRIEFPVAWMRTRRDHERFLNLIEVSAFLHQYQRERKAGAIVATLDDYAVAYELASGVLAETLTDLRKPLRDAYERVKALCAGGQGTVSRREVREELAQPDSTVRRWLAELVDLEYLAVVEAGGKGAGKTARYRLADRAPKAQARIGLLTPDELRARLRRP